MGDKLKGVLKKNKWVFIIMIAIWIFLSILLAAPIAVSIVEATNNDGSSDAFFAYLFEHFGNIGENISKAFQANYIKTFGKTEGYVSIAVLIMFVIGIIKAMPKNEYTDIEHGSSDWANGEEYSILNKKNGIILAEKHYLPVDKRGNVNILVVGRFRFSENLHHMLFQMLINC